MMILERILMMSVRFITIGCGCDNVYMIAIRVIDYDLHDGMWVGGWVGGVWRIGKISPWPLVTVSTVSSSALFFKMFIKF